MMIPFGPGFQRNFACRQISSRTSSKGAFFIRKVILDPLPPVGIVCAVFSPDGVLLTSGKPGIFGTAGGRAASKSSFGIRKGIPTPAGSALIILDLETRNSIASLTVESLKSICGNRMLCSFARNFRSAAGDSSGSFTVSPAIATAAKSTTQRVRIMS